MKLILTTPDRAWTTAQPTTEPADVSLTLADPTQRPWWGFGGCFNELGWQALSHLNDADREMILDELFDPRKGCRFNYCRLPIGANDYAIDWYSHHEFPDDYSLEKFSIQRDRQHLIPYIRQAKRRRPDLKLFASPWSPPTWMKRPRAYNFGTLADDERVYQAYALYFLKFVQAYREEGIDIHAVHVQNEPDSDQKFPSCKWSARQFIRFIGQNLGPLFIDQKEACEIWLGTIERPEYARWLGPVMLDPQASRHVKGAGFQWAGRHCVHHARQAHPDLPMIQTENECGDGTNSWSYAHHVFSLIRHYLSAEVQAYVYWNMVLEPGGQSTWGWKQNAMITVDPSTRRAVFNPEFYVMKHFSHFVEVGARRIPLHGMWSVHALGLLNPDGSRVIVMHNPYDREVKVSVEKINVALPPMSLATLVV